MPVLTATEYERNLGALRDSSTGKRPEQVEFGTLELQARLAELSDEPILIAPSTFTEFAIKVPFKEENRLVPFSFGKRRYLKQIYDSSAKRLLLKSARQTEKSTLLANRSLAFCCLNNNFQVLYVSPTAIQTKTFSNKRLKEAIELSDVLRNWQDTTLADNMGERQFLNRSRVTMRSAFLNADRTRGESADQICLDELQDFITDNIPVIEQAASHSPFKLFVYAGTPKTYDNPIEFYWNRFSTQNEWVVPCHRHTPIHWNVLGEEHLDLKAGGLVCDRCFKTINAQDPMCTWVSMNPGVRSKLDEPYEGFRISQLMVPWTNWSEILDTYATYPRARFYNEVLGLSFDSGTRPLSRAEIQACCDDSVRMDLEGLIATKNLLGGAKRVYMGIDWGGGSVNSFTVVSLGAYINGTFTIFYIHRFENQDLDPDAQMDKIQKLIAHWGVSMIGVDYGGGLIQNNTLTKIYGSERVFKYQYSQPSKKVVWKPKLNHFLVHRSEVMTDIFSAIRKPLQKRLKGKRRPLVLPAWQFFETPFSNDLLSIFSEYNEKSRLTQYKHAPDSPDDSFHSILLTCLVSLLHEPNPDLLDPTAAVSGEG